MRGKITDQDLTNYALNDGLDPRERLYVESMLAVSEECRGDIYKCIDLAQLLEKGFESEQEHAELPCLTEAQRTALLTARPRVKVLPFVRKTAATLALAACAAFALIHPQLWPSASRQSIAQVSSQVSRFVDDAWAPQQPETDISTLVGPSIVETDDDASLIQASDPMPDAMPQPAAICTPPSLQDPSESTESVESTEAK
jgi:hypothetical protein